MECGSIEWEDGIAEDGRDGTIRRDGRGTLVGDYRERIGSFRIGIRLGIR